MENKNFTEILKQKRMEYRITQQTFSTIAGISREYLNKIENGKAIVPAEKQEQLLKVLESMNPNLPLTMLFDYVRIRFKTQDLRHVVEDILRMNLKYFAHEDHGFYSYHDWYYIGDVSLLTSPREDMGILLELKGKGCRQFEIYLMAQNRTWYEFFQQVKFEGGIMKRLDLAINDRAGMLDIPMLTEKCKKGEWISYFNAYEAYQSGGGTKKLEQEPKQEEMGHTLYLGSKKSEIYFCIYRKDYEQYVKLGIPLEDTPIKNRFEIRLKNERAEKALEDLLIHEDAEKTAFGIITHYVRFVDKDNKKSRESWTLNPMWAHFIGENRENLKLTTEPEPYTPEKTRVWISHQVAPTLKIMTEVDEKNGTAYIKNIMDNVVLKEHHKKLLEQLTLSVEDIVIL